MSLKPIVTALGGDLYACGTRASIPGPGHSAADRSVSLLVSDGRLVIHGFGGSDWRQARDALRRGGFIDDQGRLLDGAMGRSPPGAGPRPDGRARREVAERLWRDAGPITPGTPAARHLALRGAPRGLAWPDLRQHPAAPVRVYGGAGPTRPALFARISDRNGRLAGLEITYLDGVGRRAAGLAIPRKTVGRVPAGSAVRLSPAAPSMLVAEGVFTTLSAVGLFGLPGWALLSANNLAVWSPPAGARRVLVAADRGAAGERAAAKLAARLRAAGRSVRVIWPEAPFGDWNEAASAAAGQREE